MSISSGRGLPNPRKMPCMTSSFVAPSQRGLIVINCPNVQPNAQMSAATENTTSPSNNSGGQRTKFIGNTFVSPSKSKQDWLKPEITVCGSPEVSNRTNTFAGPNLRCKIRCPCMWATPDSACFMMSTSCLGSGYKSCMAIEIRSRSTNCLWR